MNKNKLKVSFEIDRYKVIGMLSRNCENAEEYNEIMGILEGKSEFVRDANGPVSIISFSNFATILLSPVVKFPSSMNALYT